MAGAIPGGRAFAGRRILVVEDDFMVAQALAQMLEDAGAVVLGPIGRVEEAIRFLADDCGQMDGAVLDVNLHGQDSYPIADVLTARGVRVVFTTGYDSGALREAYRGFARCEKPYQMPDLFAALAPP